MATTATAVEFNPTRQGKFKVLIGDSLKPGADDVQSSNAYSSFRYNTVPPSGPSKLTQSDNGQFSLSYDDVKETSYTGAQRPGRKLECILVYNPKDNTFTLERTSSVFTFNQSHPFSDIAPIPTATYEDEATITITAGNSDDEDAQLADAENPFDVRHFANRVLPNSEDEDDDRDDQKDEDSDVEMEDADSQTGAAVAAAAAELGSQEFAVTPGQSASTPIPAASSATSTPKPSSSLGVIKRKPKKQTDPFMKPSRKPKAPAASSSNPGRSPLLHPDMAASHGKEASMSPQPRLPSPMHLDRKLPTTNRNRVQQRRQQQQQQQQREEEEEEEEAAESSESDVDSSDEDDDNDRRRPPPVNKHIQPFGMSREPSFNGSILSNNAPDELEFPDPKSEDNGGGGEEEDFDFGAELLAEFQAEVDGGGGDELTIEGDDDSRLRFGLGISSTDRPMSMNSMLGGGNKDESEESSEEE